MATEIPYTLGDYFDVPRRRWNFHATLLPAAILIAVYFAFTLPPIYRSTATILLEPSSIPQDFIRTTVTAYADQQLQLVLRRVFTTDNLEPLVEEIDPYPGRGDLSVRAKANLIGSNTQTQRVDPFTLEPLNQSNAISISYYNPDPDIAVAIARRLADMLLSYNRESRTEQATETYQFLQEQAEDAKATIADLEERLADFRSEYGDALPDARARNQQSLDRAERELDSMQQQILLANERKRMYEVQLSQINPNLFDPAGDWRAELAEARAELAVAQRRYTADHPDVRRLRRHIEALSARVDEGGPEPVPDNPEYIQVQNQLDTVNSEIEVLESGADRVRQQIDEYEHSIRIAPEVEPEYNELMREYKVAQDRFAGIANSLRTAALGQELESEARGDRMTLIRNANRPGRPDSPNRLGIILLGIVLGGGLAVGLAAFVESSDPTIRSTRDLTEITDIKPLAAIPVILNRADRRHRAIAWATGLTAAAAAIAFVSTIVAEGTS